MKKIIDEQWFEENVCIGCFRSCKGELYNCDLFINLPDAPEDLKNDS
jgi:hypothetical protein